MNGYELANRMRKTRRSYPLTSTEQALYYELIAICNEDEWPDVFSCSNDELCRALGIVENTLVTARLTLIQRGLLFYKSGKSKRQISQYSFVKPFTTSKNEVDAEGDAEVVSEVDAEGDAATNAADIYKTETETQTKKIEGPPPGKKKDGKVKVKKIGYRENVHLLQSENDKLVSELGQEFVDACYDHLSAYKIEKDYKTKDDNLTIRRWVIDAVKEKQARTARTPVVKLPANMTFRRTASDPSLNQW